MCRALACVSLHDVTRVLMKLHIGLGRRECAEERVSVLIPRASSHHSRVGSDLASGCMVEGVCLRIEVTTTGYELFFKC